jgi:hypothetical protein
MIQGIKQEETTAYSSKYWINCFRLNFISNRTGKGKYPLPFVFPSAKICTRETLLDEFKI